MKQEPEAIKSITHFTNCTLQNLKTQLLQKLIKSQFKACAHLLSECMDSFEILITQIISSLGNQYANFAQKLTTVDSALLAMKVQNNSLKFELENAKSIILQKQLKIQALESSNASLTENIALLQTALALQNQVDLQDFEDSLQNIDTADLEEYISNQSSIQSQVEELSQLDYNA